MDSSTRPLLERQRVFHSCDEDETRIGAERSTARISLKFTRDFVTLQLAALLGMAVEAPLEFAPAIDLTGGYGQNLARYLALAVADIERTGSLRWSPATASQFEQ